MHQSIVALTLALLARAEPAAPPAKGELVPEAPPGFRIEYATDAENPPAGTAAELKLWREGMDALPRITLVRRQSFSLRAKVRSQELDTRLLALRKQAEHEEAERLEQAGRRLEAAFRENVDIYSRQWPVDPTRACGYPHMFYDSALRLPPGPNRQAEVTNATEAIQTCVRQARGACDQMEASNQRLAGAIDAAERALASAEAHRKHEEQEHRGGEGK